MSGYNAPGNYSPLSGQVANPGGIFGGNASLAANLVSYWKLDTTGWIDQVSGNTLSNTNGVTVVAKPGGAPANMYANVANFVSASSQSLTTSATAYRGNTTLSFAFWFLAPSDEAGQVFFRDDGGANRDYTLASLGSNQATLTFLNTGQAVNLTKSMVANSWHLVAGSVNTGSNQLGFSMDGSVFATSALSGSYTAYTTPLTVGLHHTGQMSGLGWWSKVLSSTDLSNLWNGGAGTFY